VIGFAERIRSGADGRTPAAALEHAADIAAAAWRLVRVADDLEAAGNSGAARPDLRLAEVDVARLVRRVVRLAAPAAEAAGVTIDGHGLPERGQARLVVADESALWSVIDNLLRNAVCHAGRGAAVAIKLREPDHGLALEIADDGPGLDGTALDRILEAGKTGHGLGFCRELARANGAELQIETAPGQGLAARLLFPPARCLNPV
jgi:signal transduction histidine kinase